MFTDKELISKLQELRQIKPEKEWAFLTKTRILGQDLEKESSLFPTFRFLFQPRLAYAGLAFVFVLVGLFGFSQNSVPGDSLYSLKKIIEKSQAVFVSEQDRPQASLELASKRLEELVRITEGNRTKNMAPAINEVKESVSKANKNLSGLQATNLDPVAIKNIVDEIEQKVQAISSFGVVVGEEEEFEELKQSSDRLYAEYLVSFLRTRTLTKEQEEVLNRMEELVGEERYSDALILHSTEFDKPVISEEEMQKEEDEAEEAENILD